MPSATASTRDRILDAAQDLVLERGITATTVDAVLAASGASKGAFFHHFPTKAALGEALVERYAQGDAAVLERVMAEAESRTSDPAAQLVEFVRSFEEAIDDLALSQPGCLFVSFIYEQMPDGAETKKLIAASIELWRNRILAKLQEAATARPPALPVDLESLADQVFTVFEGGFILARAMNDPRRLPSQLAHLRAYLTLVLQVSPSVTARGRRRKPS